MHRIDPTGPNSGIAPPPAGPPLIILVGKTSFLLALARRHNLPLIFTFPLQPGSTMSQPLVIALTRQVTGLSPTQPQNCGQSPVCRRPAKHLQTTADFRLGRQVTLAQPAVRGTVSGVPISCQAQVKAAGFNGIVSLFLLLELLAQHLLLVISLNTIMHYYVMLCHRHTTHILLRILLTYSMSSTKNAIFYYVTPKHVLTDLLISRALLPANSPK